jgi:hypothetical protein
MRRTLLAALGGVTITAAACVAVSSAYAIEVTCIEASKYKHLYQLFGNDRRKLAEHLQIGEAKLPDGETCRAVLVTGRIEPPSKAKETGQPTDVEKLYAAIVQNQGWLATVYLASRGGNSVMGFHLGQLTRMFWLKTVAVDAKTLLYLPDFVTITGGEAGAAPPALAALQVAPDMTDGWRRYMDLVGQTASVALPPDGTRCASACTFLHVAGIDRRGPSYVHRPRFGKKGADGKQGIDVDRSLADTLEGMQRHEATIVAFYRNMDAGDEFIRLFQATSTASLTKAVTDRIPRYVSDLLRARCGTDLAQLETRESKLRATIEAADSAGKTAEAEKARTELAALPARRNKFEHCIAAAHEKERFIQFAKLCRDGCDRSVILSTVRSKIQQLNPTPAVPASPIRRPG